MPLQLLTGMASRVQLMLLKTNNNYFLQNTCMPKIKHLFVILFFMTSILAKAQGDTAIYQEPYRPQIHFSPNKGWMNDPNGMVYNDGIYHLFFQYNPRAAVWGNLSWGHERV